MSNTVIRVEHLSKSYQYGAISHGTLTKDLQSWWARVRGKDDPNAILTHSARSGQSGQRFWALQDVSFDVKQGEIVGIIGRNGAGKSTLLKILSEITTPTDGCVKLKGRVGSLLEVGTGFHPELTGRENIFLNGAILGMTKAEIRTKFDEIVAFAEIEEFLDTPVKRYSSGMYVRLAFAVAAHLDPEILLVDEVLAVGDAAFQKKCLGKMEDVAKEGRTILFVSHNMAAILSLCTKSILIDKGLLSLQDSTQKIVEEYIKKTKNIGDGNLLQRSDRMGSSEVKLAFVKITGVGNSTTIYCDSRLEIQIGYSTSRSISHINFAIGIFDYMGSEVYFMATDITKGFPEILPSIGVIRCVTESINLTPGACYINIAIVKGGVMHGGEFVDYIQNAASFNVEPNDFYGTGILPPRNWALCLISHQWFLEE